MSILRSALPASLRELRLLMCQHSPESAGTRQFVVAQYPELKKNNPDLPILIRECVGTPARAFARFERGLERNVMLDGLDEKSVATKLTELIKSHSSS